MENTVTYYTDAPRINRTFADILAAFKKMRSTGVSPKMMREHFLKDELLAIAFWFADKAAQAEGEYSAPMFAEYEEVGHE